MSLCLVRGIKEAVYVLVASLTFYELSLSLGLDSEGSVYLSVLLALTLYCSSGLRFFIFSKSLSGDLHKVVNVRLGSVAILQRVKLKAVFKPRIYVNLAGFVAPVTLAFLILALQTHCLSVAPFKYLSTLMFLTITYNRLSTIVSGRGIFISVTSSMALTVVTALALGTHLKLAPETLFLITYSLSTLAVLIGMDLVNLRLSALFKGRSVVIGGYGIGDAIFLLPAVSSLTSKIIYSLIVTPPIL